MFRLYPVAMSEVSSLVVTDHLPFYITAPGESDVLFGAVALALVLIIVAFGAFISLVKVHQS